ncbi:MAG: hypothetical protein LBM13_06475 [Candidatus Ancillula sp.]|jgi:hypothetical protein|nr:hypothetical protein [Candidatus Ancillula sp.]
MVLEVDILVYNVIMNLIVGKEVPDWSYVLDHLKRSKRIVGEVDIKQEWADESYADPKAVVFDPDYNSITGRGIRTIGYSRLDGFCITTITVWDNSYLWGASAWKSNTKDLTYYNKGGKYEN